jgi:hypothetical protein
MKDLVVGMAVMFNRTYMDLGFSSSVVDIPLTRQDSDHIGILFHDAAVEAS